MKPSMDELKAALVAAQAVLQAKRDEELALERQKIDLTKKIEETREALREAHHAVRQAEIAIDAAKPLSPTKIAFLRRSAEPGGVTYQSYTSRRHDSHATREGVIAESLKNADFISVETKAAIGWGNAPDEVATITELGKQKLAEAESGARRKKIHG